MVLSDNGASREGGPFGVMDEFSFFNGMWEDIDEHRRRPPRRHRRPALALATTRGAGPRPATRRCAGTSRTPTAAACATRWSCTGPSGIADRGGDPPRSSATPSTSRRRSSTSPARRCPTRSTASPQMPMHGASHRADVRRRRRAGAAARCSTSSRWATAASGPTAGRPPPTTSRATPFDDDEWGLFHLDEDFSECHDLAAEHPEQAARADRRCGGSRPGQHGVLPLDDRTIELFGAPPRPGTVHARRRATCTSRRSRTSPPTRRRRSVGATWTITADVDVAGTAASRACCTPAAATTSATSFFVQDGELHFDYNALGTHHRARGAARARGRAATR